MIGAVGAGLMYTVTAFISNAAMIGYQILVGVSIFTRILWRNLNKSDLTDIYRYNATEHLVRYAG
jgi:hypothetical protein